MKMIYVANHSGPLSLCTNVQTLRELWPTWHFRGPCLHRPTLWKAFLCPECSLYTIAHQLAKVWALLYMLGVALGAMSPSGNTKVLSLLAIAQRLEARWPDSEGQRFDSQKSWSAKPLNGKQTWPTSCRPTTTSANAKHSDPLLLCTTGQKHWKFHYETQWYDWKRTFARRHWSEWYVMTIFPNNMIFLRIYWKRCAMERIT